VNEVLWSDHPNFAYLVGGAITLAGAAICGVLAIDRSIENGPIRAALVADELSAARQASVQSQQ